MECGNKGALLSGGKRISFGTHGGWIRLALAGSVWANKIWQELLRAWHWTLRPGRGVACAQKSWCIHHICHGQVHRPCCCYPASVGPPGSGAPGGSSSCLPLCAVCVEASHRSAPLAAEATSHECPWFICAPAWLHWFALIPGGPNSQGFQLFSICHAMQNFPCWARHCIYCKSLFTMFLLSS